MHENARSIQPTPAPEYKVSGTEHLWWLSVSGFAFFSSTIILEVFTVVNNLQLKLLKHKH